MSVPFTVRDTGYGWQVWLHGAWMETPYNRGWSRMDVEADIKGWIRDILVSHAQEVWDHV